MLENDLRQLQRLGVDIWVSPEQAHELITSGKAKSLLDDDSAQSSETPSALPPRTRSWERRKRADASRPATRPTSNVRTRPDNRKPISESPAPTVGNVSATPFDVQLKVYLYGSVGTVVERTEPCPDILIKDILRALSRFEDHQLNELHFKFPLVGPGKRETSLATLGGAQEGFQAWFEQRTPNCESLLLIGSPASDTAARLIEKIPRTISIDKVPVSRDGKQRLWNQIKNLDV